MARNKFVTQLILAYTIGMQHKIAVATCLVLRSKILISCSGVLPVDLELLAVFSPKIENVFNQFRKN
jgi:hypothetical protein